MFEVLDRQTRLTGNQKKILAAAIIGDALEFFDFFLIAFVLALPDRAVEAHLRPVRHGADELRCRRHPRRLRLGLARRPHRPAQGVHRHGAELLDRHRPALLHAGQRLGLPDRLRFFVGFGVGGLYCVDLPLVQEFMPTSKRGFIGGLVTCVIPLGVGLGSVLAAFMPAPTSGACCSRSACCRRWSCCWSASGCPNRRAGSPARAACDEARKSLAWALEVDPEIAADATLGGSHGRQDQLVRPLQVSAQPAGVVARQCRRPDRRLRRRPVGAVAVRAAAARSDAAGSRQDDDPAHGRAASSAAFPSRGCPRRSAGGTRAACWASAPAS